MNGVKIEEYKIWLEKAEDDLKWTQSNLKIVAMVQNQPIPTTAVELVNFIQVIKFL